MSELEQFPYLTNKCVQEWVNMSPTYTTLYQKRNNKNYKELALVEKASFGYLLQNKGVQWSNALGENIVYEILIGAGFNVNKKPKIIIGDKTFIPDFETDIAFYEVKTRNYSTPGTCGEKILGTPMKYINIPKTTGKPLFIVLVGFQEYEATNMFGLFDSGMSINQREVINMYSNFGIYYIGASVLWNSVKIIENINIEEDNDDLY
jgi:hypothetical protein